MGERMILMDWRAECAEEGLIVLVCGCEGVRGREGYGIVR